MTNWPWPLDGIQSWVEGVVRGVFGAIEGAGRWVVENVHQKLASVFWELFPVFARVGMTRITCYSSGLRTLSTLGPGWRGSSCSPLP